MNTFLIEHPVFRYEAFSQYMKSRGVTREASIHQRLSDYHRTGKVTRIRRLLYASTAYTKQPAYIDPFLIAAQASENAILGYHTALEIHGLAYTTFEEFVFLTHQSTHSFVFQNQSFRPICHPKALIEGKNTDFGVSTIERQGCLIKVTSLERTFVDVIDRPELSGGWEEVIRSLDRITKLDIQQVVDYALLLKKGTLIAKVGFFLEQLPEYMAVDRKYIQKLQSHMQKQAHYMVHNSKKRQGSYISKWKLIVPNAIINRSWEEQDDHRF